MPINQDISCHELYLTTVQRFLRGFGPISQRELSHLERCLRRIASEQELERRKSRLSVQMNIILQSANCPHIDVPDVVSLPMAYHQFVHMNLNYIKFGGDSEDVQILSRKILQEMYSVEKAKLVVKNYTDTLIDSLHIPEDDLETVFGEIMECISEVVKAEVGKEMQLNFIEIPEDVICQIIDDIIAQHTFGIDFFNIDKTVCERDGQAASARFQEKFYEHFRLRCHFIYPKVAPITESSDSVILELYRGCIDASHAFCASHLYGCLTSVITKIVSRYRCIVNMSLMDEELRKWMPNFSSKDSLVVPGAIHRYTVSTQVGTTT